MFAERIVGSRQYPPRIVPRIACTAFASSLALLILGCGGSGAPRIGTTPQSITFANPGTQTAGTSQTLVATASSGLTVTIASTTPGTCTANGATVSYTAAGTCTLNASIAGNSTYAAAAPVAQSFSINPAIPTGTTVYIAGFAYVAPSGNSAATLWQLAPGTPTASATLLAMPGGLTNSTANAVAVSGSDVHVVGWALTATGGVALDWHNGSPTVLPSTMSLARAYAVAISGGNVYVAGFESNGSTDSNAVLWVNGVATVLPAPSGLTNATASAITVSGGNVYIVGTAFSSTLGDTAVYWVNGTPTALPQPTGLPSGVIALGIGVLNGNVYVSGDTDSGSDTTALLWQNNSPPTTLPLPPGVLPQSYGAQQITVAGNSLYIAGGGATGSSTGSGTYWLNDVPTLLSTPDNLQNTPYNAYAVQIALAGNDVYSVGTLADDFAGILEAAVYWVNTGGETLLPMPTGAAEAYANGIAVATQ